MSLCRYTGMQEQSSRIKSTQYLNAWLALLTQFTQPLLTSQESSYAFFSDLNTEKSV